MPGKSDPYAIVKLDTELIGKTRHIDNTLTPEWNETFDALLFSNTSKLNLQVFDYNNIRKDETLGQLSIKMSDVIPALKTEEDVQKSGDMLSEMRKTGDIVIITSELSTDV